MGFLSFLRCPKKEEQQVPENDVTGFEGCYYYGGGGGSMADQFGDLFEREVDDGCDSGMLMYYGNLSNELLLNWDFTKCEDIVKSEEEVLQFWDIEDATAALNLNLNYQEVLDAWSDRGSLFARDHSVSLARSGSFMGEVPEMEEDRSTDSGSKRRKASVQRYKEKRQSRLFSKKIRYQVRKLNADTRPRVKGRFVKRHQ